jgi:hypothetical protein
MFSGVKTPDRAKSIIKELQEIQQFQNYIKKTKKKSKESNKYEQLRITIRPGKYIK